MRLVVETLGRQGSSKGQETEAMIGVAKPMRGAAETGREAAEAA
jgi:hypothetical protein